MLVFVALACTACSASRWAFSPGEYNSATGRTARGGATAASLPYEGLADQQVIGQERYAAAPPGSVGPPPVRSAAADANADPNVFATSGQLLQPNASVPDVVAPPAAEPAGIVSIDDDEAGQFRFPRMRRWWDETRTNVRHDLRNYYSWSTAGKLAVGLGFGATLANTSIDQHFRNWYQEHAHGQSTDEFAEVWRSLGEGAIYIPVFATLGVVGKMCDDTPVLCTLGELGDRTTRAYLVGFPPMLLAQFALGASRPEERMNASYWRPFQDTNAVSGHAFIGSIPFITAAQMSDNYLLKGGFYVCSTFTAWSRVNDDRHYLSQICLGWWMGYLACSAVTETEEHPRAWSLEPVVTPEMTGVGLTITR